MKETKNNRKENISALKVGAGVITKRCNWKTIVEVNRKTFRYKNKFSFYKPCRKSNNTERNKRNLNRLKIRKCFINSLNKIWCATSVLCWFDWRNVYFRFAVQIATIKDSNLSLQTFNILISVICRRTQQTRRKKNLLHFQLRITSYSLCK